MKTVFLPAGLNHWQVPDDFNPADNRVDTLGAGQNGVQLTGHGGEAGDHASISDVALTPGAIVAYQIGQPGDVGGDTWLLAANAVLAAGGGSPTTSVGDVVNPGGNGSGMSGPPNHRLNGAGGGAGGPDGAGGDAQGQIGGVANGGAAHVWTQTSDNATASPGNGGHGADHDGTGATAGGNFGGGGSATLPAALGFIAVSYEPV
jgi:hypothetical protein